MLKKRAGFTTALFLLFSIGMNPLPGFAEVKLDLDFFKNEVQPIFLAKRTGNIRCIDCHAGKAYSRFNIMPLLDPGEYF